MILSYNAIVEIAKEIIENGKIPIENLVMVYYLPPKMHHKLNEDLFFRINNPTDSFEPSKVIEIEVGGVNFRVEVEKKLSDNLEI